MHTTLARPRARWSAAIVPAVLVVATFAAIGIAHASTSSTFEARELRLKPAANLTGATATSTTTTSHPPTTTTTAATTTTSHPPTTTTTAAPTTTTTAAPAFDPNDRSPGWEQRAGAAALARIHFDWQRLGYTVRFLPAQPGHLGMTYPEEHRIDVWVRPGESLDLLGHVTAHEMGHAVDMSWNDAARRSRYLQVRGISPRNWFTCNGCSDFATPAGDFAETFAYWALGGTDFRSTLAPPPSAADLEALAPIFEPTP